MSAPWGPFMPDLDPGERKLQLRTLRTAAKLLLGPRGAELNYRLLVAELSPDDPDVVAAADREVERLGPLDRRRLLSSFGAVAFADMKIRDGAACTSPALAGIAKNSGTR